MRNSLRESLRKSIQFRASSSNYSDYLTYLRSSAGVDVIHPPSGSARPGYTTWPCAKQKHPDSPLPLCLLKHALRHSIMHLPSVHPGDPPPMLCNISAFSKAAPDDGGGGVLLLRITTSKIPGKLPRVTGKLLALSGTPHCTEP